MADFDGPPVWPKSLAELARGADLADNPARMAEQQRKEFARDVAETAREYRQRANDGEPVAAGKENWVGAIGPVEPGIDLEQEWRDFVKSQTDSQYFGPGDVYGRMNLAQADFGVWGAENSTKGKAWTVKLNAETPDDGADGPQAKLTLKDVARAVEAFQKWRTEQPKK